MFDVFTLHLQQALRMRIRMTYTLNGASSAEQGEVNNFPPATWQ
jgi:hypothetical protein